MNLSSYFFFFFFPFCFFLWLVSGLAELSRSPFDFSESESELVSGFNLDFGSSVFSLIFMGEYSMLLLFSLLTCFLFLNLLFFPFLFFFFIWVRSMVPRYRFDKFLLLGWKFFVPFLTFYLVLFCVF